MPCFSSAAIPNTFFLKSNNVLAACALAKMWADTIPFVILLVCATHQSNSRTKNVKILCVTWLNTLFIQSTCAYVRKILSTVCQIHCIQVTTEIANIECLKLSMSMHMVFLTSDSSTICFVMCVFQW